MSDPALPVCPVSFGLDVRRPGQLEEIGLYAVLLQIGQGRWHSEVESVRKGKKSKMTMPYFTPSGLFRHRSNAGLIKHNGHVAVDLDHLGERGATRAIQNAIKDRFCRFAFRSVSAKGIRLGFGCPPASSETHSLIFRRVAEYVRKRYGIQPDTSGSDVCRASFVSFDRGLWVNPSAELLPGLQALAPSPELHTESTESLCEPTALDGADVVTLAFGLGESRAPRRSKPDGTAYTHQSLRDLGRDLVVRFKRHDLALADSEVEQAFRAWWTTAKRNGLKLRLGPDAYRLELSKCVQTARRAPWIARVAGFWTRWTQEPEFPHAATSREKLGWAIRRHCLASGTKVFFLAARDAATITGTSFRAANATLHSMVRAGTLKRVGKRRCARDAQTFRLAGL